MTAATVTIIGTPKGTIEEKRCYLEGVVISAVCPKCGATTTRDMARDYLSYPIMNVPIEEYMYCGQEGGCENEFPIKIILRVSLEASP